MRRATMPAGDSCTPPPHDRKAGFCQAGIGLCDGIRVHEFAPKVHGWNFLLGKFIMAMQESVKQAVFPVGYPVFICGGTVIKTMFSVSGPFC